MPSFLQAGGWETGVKNKKFYAKWMRPLGFLFMLSSAGGIIVINIHMTILHEPHDPVFDLANVGLFATGVIMWWVSDSLRYLELRIEELEKRSQSQSVGGITPP